jgi:hypothetical protein
VVPILVGVVVFVGLLTSFFWWTIIAVGMIYMLSIVVSGYLSFRNRHNVAIEPVEDTDLT